MEHGLHATDQLSVRVDDLSLIQDAMARLRATPPTSLGGRAVESAEDLAAGSDELPPTDGLRYRLADGGRVVVRPSGTEPKLKCYLEVVVPVQDRDVPAAREIAARDLAAISADSRRRQARPGRRASSWADDHRPPVVGTSSPSAQAAAGATVKLRPRDPAGHRGRRG